MYKVSHKRIFEVPKLMVGLDTETTGLGERAQPITYGLIVYRNGSPVDKIDYDVDQDRTNSFIKSLTGGVPVWQSNKTNDSFVVYPSERYKGSDGRPFVEPDASRINGWTDDMLRSSRDGKPILHMPGDSFRYPPAVPAGTGLSRMLTQLAHLQKQGATFVGANTGYDYRLMTDLYAGLHNGLPIAHSGFDPLSANNIDVIAHDLTMRGDPTRMSSSGKLVPDRRSQEKLAIAYGVPYGAHKAYGDASTSVEIAKRQIAVNRGELELP